MTSVPTIAIAIFSIMTLGGFGLLYLAYTDTYEFEMNQLIIGGATGMLGFVALLYTMKAYGRNIFFAELTRSHGIAIVVIIIIIVLVLNYYGVFEWLQSSS